MHAFDSRATALVVIDLQNDFLAPGGAYDRGGAVSPQARALPARVAPLARALKAAGGFVAASQFTLWPDAQGEPMISPHLKRLRPFLARGDFAAGSTGHANVAAFDGLIDVSVCKVAYSAFFNTQLDWVLRRAGISNLIVAGIVTNGGVASTCCVTTPCRGDHVRGGSQIADQRKSPDLHGRYDRLSNTHGCITSVGMVDFLVL